MDKTAFFDFDGTLINGKSEMMLFWYMFEKKKINLIKLLFSYIFIMLKTKRIDKFLFKEYKPYLVGFSIEQLKRYSVDIYNNKMKKSINPIMFNKMMRLKKKGYKIVIVTATYGFLIEPFLKEFKIRDSFSTKFIESNSIKNMGIKGIIPYGKRKEFIVREYCKKNNVKLSSCVAYGDSDSDKYMINAVGNHLV